MLPIVEFSRKLESRLRRLCFPVNGPIVIQAKKRRNKLWGRIFDEERVHLNTQILMANATSAIFYEHLDEKNRLLHDVAKDARFEEALTENLEGFVQSYFMGKGTANLPCDESS